MHLGQGPEHYRFQVNISLFLPSFLQVIGQMMGGKCLGKQMLWVGDMMRALVCCFANKRLCCSVEETLHQLQTWTQGLHHPQSQLTLRKTFLLPEPQGRTESEAFWPDQLFLRNGHKQSSTGREPGKQGGEHVSPQLPKGKCTRQ